MLQSFSRRLIITTVIGDVLIFWAVVLRFWLRKRSAMSYGADDVVLLLSLIPAWAISGLYLYTGAINALDKKASDEAGMLEGRKYTYLLLILAFPFYALSKAAVVLFCKRIFTTRNFTIISNLMLVILTLWGVSGTVTQILATRPINSWWTNYFPLWRFKWERFFLYLISSNLLLDIAVWLQPILAIRNLHLSFRRKVLLSGVFALGFICIITAGLRLYWAVQVYKVIKFQLSLDRFTETIFWSIIWAIIESTLLLISICLPTFGPLFIRSSTPEPKPQSAASWYTSRGSISPIYNEQLPLDTMEAGQSPRDPRFVAGPRWDSSIAGFENVSTSTTTPPDRGSKTDHSDGITVERTFGYHTQWFTDAKIPVVDVRSKN